jgi:hypothetical protein
MTPPRPKEAEGAVRRRIVGIQQHGAGEWIAKLSCLHEQRHSPRALDDAQQQARVGTEVDCPRCDRAGIPRGLQLARIAGPFTNDTLPAGLRRTHRVGDRTVI